ncbi:DNA-binding transcriptional repressor DeoR [Robbsia sp. Bb-Pol-6]|uniref:DNA-binding transcriptional repressor DeoR n=1 Tax=Robbsia betulipollinis TaxID=2981849 RepID=A0ABT3ZHW0_9BURK|nr:DNA-binding transcriptional repressor DeoR [Robbsia betulipollinis]MCY0386114.1 DNA-binding transcriptional repressor DeoR [Robbsia betulipollinis]
MESKRTVRLKSVAQTLQKQNAIHLRDMAELLDVSEMTLRRDLDQHDGDLRLLGGYITRIADPAETSDYRVNEQDSRQIEEKRRIGRLAAAFVRQGDTIFLDCGTTTPFVVDFIPDDLAFTAVCNSLNVLLRLQQKPNCTIILCGGTFHRHNLVFENRTESSVLDGIRLAHAFISAAGVSRQFGVTCFNLDEVDVKRKVLRQAQQCLLLADHTKFDTVRAAYFAELADFHFVVSDKKISRDYRDFFTAGETRLLI